MHVLHDLFPATLVVAPASFTGELTAAGTPAGVGRVDSCRVIVTDELVVAVVDSPEGPRLVFQERYADFTRSRRAAEDSLVTTASGKRLAFRKDASCGCGSRLRSWSPTGALAALTAGAAE